MLVVIKGSLKVLMNRQWTPENKFLSERDEPYCVDKLVEWGLPYKPSWTCKKKDCYGIFLRNN